jgi:hypothetical protein
MSEADARALVDTWLKAQNEGDFHTYQSLYAQTFQGIKRVGKRTEPFDRVGWMADRGWMFETPDHGKPMRVEIKEVEAEVNEASAQIRFIQSFSRGNFADKGPKQLDLVIEGREVRIGREEMSSSHVVKRARRTPGKARRQNDDSWTFVGGQAGDAVGGWGPPSEELRPKRGKQTPDGIDDDGTVSPNNGAPTNDGFAPSESPDAKHEAIQ